MKNQNLVYPECEEFGRKSVPLTLYPGLRSGSESNILKGHWCARLTRTGWPQSGQINPFTPRNPELFPSALGMRLPGTYHWLLRFNSFLRVHWESRCLAWFLGLIWPWPLNWRQALSKSLHLVQVLGNKQFPKQVFRQSAKLTSTQLPD